jgi:heat shock protein HslJ
MKKFLSILLAAFITIGCTSTTNSTDFSELIDKEWKLTRVYINNIDTQFRRDNQPEMFSDIFTLNFDEQNVSGTGAPNLYSAPYTLNENQGISIKPMRSTLMASIFEPENLSEHNFFLYLQSASMWSLVNDNLEILSTSQDGNQVRLVFGL